MDRMPAAEPPNGATPSGVVLSGSEYGRRADAVEGVVSDWFDVAADLSRNQAIMAGLQIEAIYQASRCDALNAPCPPAGMRLSAQLRLRSLRAELALALHIPERSAETLLSASTALVEDLPATLTALKGGEISYRHAQIMVDQTYGMDDDARLALETIALPHARALTAAKFRKKLTVLRETIHPETMVERHTKAACDREVTLQPAADGMAWLSAYLPAEIAVGVSSRLTDIGHSLLSPDEPRTLTQLRADVFCDLLTDGEPTQGSRGIRPRVFVTVPVLTLLGQVTPASLDGYGPIDPATARRLAARAPSFTRLLTHPETGAVLSVGRDSYTVPRDLKNWLQVRDHTCRFPGCSRHASQCDIDHTRNWEWGGGTRHDNLAHLCRGHHTLKHNSSWRVAHADGGGGVLTWTSPTGRNYTTQPETRMRI